VAVPGDGAAWIWALAALWALAAGHFPRAVQTVDRFHASERVGDPGRALLGAGAAETAAGVARRRERLAAGEATRPAAEWSTLRCRGEAAAGRDEQVTCCANQAGRMAHDRYRAAGWDIGSGMVEGACEHLTGAREKGPGMRWSEAGAETVAAARVVLSNDRWDELWAAQPRQSLRAPSATRLLDDTHERF